MATAYRCGLFRHVPFEPSLAQVIPDLSRRLQRLERGLEWMGSLEKRVTITVLGQDKNQFKVHGYDLLVSEDVLRAEGQIEKAILKVWIRERNQKLAQNFPGIEESLTDLMLFSFSGALLIQDPRTGMILEEDQVSKWPRVLTNLQGYCQSPWRASEHLGFCDKVSADAKMRSELFPETLRALVSQSLIETLGNLSGGERIQWLKNFSKGITQLQTLDFATNANSPFDEATASLQQWMRLMASIPGDIRTVGKFAWLFRQQLEKRGFGTDGSHQLETLVFQDHVSPELENNLKSSLTKNKEHYSFAIETDEDLILDSETPLKKSMFSQFRAVKGLYLNCGVLDLHRLQALAARVQRLIYVDACGVKALRLEGLLGRGPMSFALQNPQMKFVDFHAASLLAALLKMPGINPIDALSQNQQGNSFLKKIGWDKPDFDKSVGAYRARSVIEAIDWYRL